jgi:plasmid maintenance system antidote protein VapI
MANVRATSRIGRLLLASGRNKNDLVRATCIPEERLSALLAGKRGPTIPETAYLAKAFGVPPRVVNPGLTDDQL